jgi:ribonuclease HII
MKGAIGIDEVGRGPLAGPVTVCAFYMEDTQEVLEKIFANTVKDSKKLTKDIRNKIYQTIRKSRTINTRTEYAISSRSAEFIDKHGIVKAIDACIISCFKQLYAKGVEIEKVAIRLDGGLKVKHFPALQSTYIKGDELYPEIALASIMAKVHRDSYMERLGKKWKGYKWEENAGYGTKFHIEAIKKLGKNKYHRTTYLKAF